jgi:hypothetical protein
MLRVKLQMQMSYARSRRLKTMQRETGISQRLIKKADTAMRKAQTA